MLALGQIQHPQIPQFNTFQPVAGGHANNGYNAQYTSPVPQVPMGAHADDIMRQANSRNGMPPNGLNQIDQQEAVQEWVLEQKMNNPAYNSSIRNPVNSKMQSNQNSQIVRLLRENQVEENPAESFNKLRSGYYQSQDFANQTKPYTDALKQLNGMLTDKQKLSVANAYYISEAAYGGSYLTQKEFKAKIAQSVDFIRQWMQQNGLALTNNDDVHLAIQKFMSESLTIRKNKITHDKASSFGSVTHSPFYYDYGDYQGEKDHKNFFLSKCLATGFGQCSSMPAVYLALAEGLGVKAYLTIAPQHSFIKYPDNSGNIVNYEPTSNWKMSDKWYQDNLSITPQAVRNRIYLDTLNSRQVVADCIVYMAWGYLKKHGAADGSFVGQCLKAAQKEFSNENLSLRFVHSSMLARMLSVMMHYEHISTIEQVKHSKACNDIYRQLEENEALIKKLGYAQQPAEIYSELLKSHEFKGKVQEKLQINGKEKRNLFIETH